MNTEGAKFDFIMLATTTTATTSHDGHAIQDRWGEGLGGGFVVIPSVLLQHQRELELDCEAVVVLANLLAHWYYDDRMPYPRTETLAKRTGISRRTVQRRIQLLEAKGFVKRQVVPGDDQDRTLTLYDLRGTVEKLKPLGLTAREVRSVNQRRTEQPGSSGRVLTVEDS